MLITDFGLARQLVQNSREKASPANAGVQKARPDKLEAGTDQLAKSSSGAPVGTYAWMSPEAIRTGHFSKASDVWRYNLFLPFCMLLICVKKNVGKLQFFKMDDFVGVWTFIFRQTNWFHCTGKWSGFLMFQSIQVFMNSQLKMCYKKGPVMTFSFPRGYF